MSKPAWRIAVSFIAINIAIAGCGPGGGESRTPGSSRAAIPSSLHSIVPPPSEIQSEIAKTRFVKSSEAVGLPLREARRLLGISSDAADKKSVGMTPEATVFALPEKQEPAAALSKDSDLVVTAVIVTCGNAQNPGKVFFGVASQEYLKTNPKMQANVAEHSDAYSLQLYDIAKVDPKSRCYGVTFDE